MPGEQRLDRPHGQVIYDQFELARDINPLLLLLPVTQATCVTQCVELEHDVVAVRPGSCSWDSFECRDPSAQGKPARQMDCNGSAVVDPSSMSYQLFVMGQPLGSTGNGTNNTSTRYFQTEDIQLVNVADSNSSGSKGACLASECLSRKGAPMKDCCWGCFLTVVRQADSNIRQEWWVESDVGWVQITLLGFEANLFEARL